MPGESQPSVAPQPHPSVSRTHPRRRHSWRGMPRTVLPQIMGPTALSQGAIRREDVNIGGPAWLQVKAPAWSSTL